MANHVWQRVNIHSEEKEVHNKLEEWFGNLDYSDVRGTVEPVFGKDWKYDIDKVGSKWVIVEDCYFDEDSSYINFCSAWNPADGFLEELMKTVLGIDEEATMDFTGDEESDDFLFAGYGSKKGFHWIMDDDNPERPWEEECEEEGIDYDEAIDMFYEEVSCITDSLVMESKKIVEGV